MGSVCAWVWTERLRWKPLGCAGRWRAPRQLSDANVPVSVSTPPSPTSFSSSSLKVTTLFCKELKIRSCQWLTEEFCSRKKMRVGQRLSSFNTCLGTPCFPLISGCHTVWKVESIPASLWWTAESPWERQSLNSAGQREFCKDLPFH